MLTPGERPLIARALAATPQTRWPSCGGLMAQLQTATAPEQTARRRSEFRNP
jgi:hypothetical protein